MVEVSGVGGWRTAVVRSGKMEVRVRYRLSVVAWLLLLFDPAYDQIEAEAGDAFRWLAVSSRNPTWISAMETRSRSDDPE